MCFFYPSFRAFGDKSSPPSIPDAEGEGQEANGEEYEVDEVEEEEEEEVEKCVGEEEQSPGETVTDQACSGVEELSLAEQEEENVEKSGNEEEEGNQDDQKMPQGTRFSHTSPRYYLSFKGIISIY